MNKINNSNELLEFIKSAAGNKRNWGNENELVVRFAFGCRNIHDTKCTADDFESTGNLDAEELLFSQEQSK